MRHSVHANVEVAWTTELCYWPSIQCGDSIGACTQVQDIERRQEEEKSKAEAKRAEEARAEAAVREKASRQRAAADAKEAQVTA